MFTRLRSKFREIREDVSEIRSRIAVPPAGAPALRATPPPVAPPSRTPSAAPSVAVAPVVELVAPEAVVAAVVAPSPVEPEPAAVEPVAAEPVEPEPVAVAPVAPSVPTVATRASPEPASPPVAPLSLLAAAAAASKGTGRLLHADMGSTDIDAYIARAKANGRDVSTVRGGTGINVADDGTVFWGPVDNDSSRAKADGRVLTVDQWECISCGTCVEQTDKVFYLPEDGKATPIAQDGPMDLIQDAIDACPVTCIHWVTPEVAAEKGLATGMDAEG